MKDQERYHEQMVYGIGMAYMSMIQAIAAYLKQYDLTPTDMNILMLVKHQSRSEGFSQVALGQKLMVTAHNMTRAIQRLEEKRLLKRIIDKDDARINLVTISPLGAKLLDDIWPGYEQVLSGLANRISHAKQKTLSGLLQEWLGDKGA